MLFRSGWIEAVALETATTPETFRATMQAQLDSVIATSPGIIGLHLLQGQLKAGQGETAEKKLRGTPDKVAAWILLVEASRSEAIDVFRGGAGSNAALATCGAGDKIERGLYQIQFALTKAELEM